MARFKIGDEVMVRAGVPAPRDFRGVVGKIVRVSDSGYFVVTGPASAEVYFSEAELKPASRRSTKSLELRAKYKAVSKKSEVDKLREKMYRLNEKMKNSRAGTKVYKEAEAEYAKTAEKIGQLLGYG